MGRSSLWDPLPCWSGSAIGWAGSEQISGIVQLEAGYASLSFDLTNIRPGNQNLEIVTEDDAYISSSGIQLTPDEIGDRTQKAGRATYVQPLHLWNNATGELASFATNFSFVIDSRQDTNYGDGLAFFLAENNSVISGGGAMGLPIDPDTVVATNRFVAVEFDTYENPWDPKVGDHVGVTISNLTGQSLASVRSQEWLSNVTGGADCEARVTYDSLSMNLSVSFTGFRNNTTIRQDGLYYTVDLRDVLPERVIFGFSAATGASFQKNNVRSWIFSIFLAFVFWMIRKKKQNREDEAQELEFNAQMNTEFKMGTGPTRFSYHKLAQSTANFAEHEKLGEGGFGGVYKGFLKDSRTFVAVKRVSKTSKQGIKEYASEVTIISRLRHRNLVQLIGWCHEKRELLLVYELMENGSLDSHLFKEKSLLTWGTRYKIAHGLASALLYLHEGWEQCVLHRDIKSSNVMLDSNFNPKLGDFGLAKLVDHEKGSQTTMLAGTLGYMAPECVVTGKASKESDVFSFGVVALEIACGRKPIEYHSPERQIRLVEWVWELYGIGTLLEAADPRLGLDFMEEEIKRLMIVGLWCAHPDSNLRPSIRQSIQVLNSEASLPILPSKMPVASYLSLPSSSLHVVASMVHNRSSSSVDDTDSSRKTVVSSTDTSSSTICVIISAFGSQNVMESGGIGMLNSFDQILFHCLVHFFLVKGIPTFQ
ncbi:hypothetical protein OSB04_014510 [Centaurea solstitialis]|uniref:non-specific serine/threonine protein kinase n=1 Tax=Centaurea solstitialis TaxID=347529 RepID=A0AA38T980_9ASTR|nr:hypothetical protein OSB04_014510 [Centaurea solstitialis]